MTLILRVRQLIINLVLLLLEICDLIHVARKMQVGHGLRGGVILSLAHVAIRR